MSDKDFSVFQQSEMIDQIATALAKAQATFVDPEHDGVVDYVDSKGKRTHYTYAKLPAVLKEIRPKLAAQGIAFTQIPFIDPVSKKIQVMTQLMHTSGQWLRGCFGLDHGQGRPQDGAGIITYERRYSISPMVGISAEADTDGNAGEPQNDGKPKENYSERKNEIEKKNQQTTKPPVDPKIYRHSPEQNARLKLFFDQNAPELSQPERVKIAGKLVGKDIDLLPQLTQEFIDEKAYNKAQKTDFETPEGF